VVVLELAAAPELAQRAELVAPARSAAVGGELGPEAHGLVSWAISRRWQDDGGSLDRRRAKSRQSWRGPADAERRRNLLLGPILAEKQLTVRYAGRLLELAAHKVANPPTDDERAEDEAKKRGVHQVEDDERPKRGAVVEFSDKSRTRLLKAASAISWRELGGELVFVTLTYPGDDSAECWPKDFREAKRHLDAFRARWRRRWCLKMVDQETGEVRPARVRGLWKQEFQHRGVVHWHLALVVDGPPISEEAMEELREWVSQAWYEVVGSKNPKHLASGTNVQSVWGNIAGYFAKYVSKGKDYQHQVPEAWGTAGRWWGVWGLRPDWQEITVPVEDWMRARRVFRRALNGTPTSPGKLAHPRAADWRVAGLWIMSREEDAWARCVELLLKE
jgi:hypothetical protein